MTAQSTRARQQPSEFSDEDGVRRLRHSDTPPVRHAGDSPAGHTVPHGVGYRIRPACWQAVDQRPPPTVVIVDTRQSTMKECRWQSRVANWLLAGWRAGSARRCQEGQYDCRLEGWRKGVGVGMLSRRRCRTSQKPLASSTGPSWSTRRLDLKALSGKDV